MRHQYADLSAAFAQAFGANSFSFESTEGAIRSIKGEIDRDYFKTYQLPPRFFQAYLLSQWNDSKSTYTNKVPKFRFRTRYHEVMLTSKPQSARFIVLSNNHRRGAEVELSDRMRTVTVATAD